MQKENGHEIVKYGTLALACLSENNETHKKLINSAALPSISKLITSQIHYDITKNCAKILANLANDPEHYDALMALECRDFIIKELLDLSDNTVQFYILKFLLGLCTNSVDRAPSLPKFLIMANYLEPILRCCVSADE